MPGGENGQSSIRNGLFELEKECEAEDILLIHDGTRAAVSTEIISDCIAKCRVHGSAITTIPCVEAILNSDDKVKSNTMTSRDKLMRTQTPHAFKLSKLLWAHREALARGITNTVASCTLMIELGETVYFSAGSEKNLKLTTTDDIEIFKALVSSKKDEWLK